MLHAPMEALTMAGILDICARVLVMLLMAAIAGCAASVRKHDESVSDCHALFERVDTIVERHQVRDYGSARIDGFPYLRVNRLLASFRNEDMTEEQYSAWTSRMAALDREARDYELRNLSQSIGDRRDEALLKQLDDCRKRMMAIELERSEIEQRLRASAYVADAYVTWWRVAGLYPVTAPFVSLEINRWHDSTHKTFAAPLNELPVQGRLLRWSIERNTPLTQEQVAAIVQASTDPLGISRPEAVAQRKLFETFAPQWEVDVKNYDDRIGELTWQGVPQVDADHPTLYRELSHTRFNGQVLLQLNYIVWFPARPGNDIYAGHLDGFNWRVTLGPDGTPWLYDAIHNCGCYYLALPSRHLQLRKDLPTAYYERPLIPQSAPEGQPITLRIASRTHFLQRAYLATNELEAITTGWQEYDTLRSLTSIDGYHSLFGKHGIVESSVRPERYLLWPMGVRSAGAMRQRGQHAIAFVGRRHFDDAHLLDELFEPVDSP
jgi:hypothetical protein